MTKDPLDVYLDKAICPTCGAIHSINQSRCPECGIFFNQEILVEREVKPQQKRVVTKSKPIDPGMYSLNPHSEIPEDDLEEIEIEDNTRSWGGGSTDFSIDDFEDAPIGFETKAASTEKELEEE